MLIFTFFVSSFVVVALYQTLGAWLVKRPWALLVIGLVVSAIGIAIKSLPVLLKSLPKFSSDAVTLELAASAVDPTLVGLSGGLIASAFLIKLEQSYRQESAENAESFARAERFREDALAYAVELAEVEATLSNDELVGRRQVLEAKRQLAFEVWRSAQKRHKRLEGQWKQDRS